VSVAVLAWWCSPTWCTCNYHAGITRDFRCFHCRSNPGLRSSPAITPCDVHICGFGANDYLRGPFARHMEHVFLDMGRCPGFQAVGVLAECSRGCILLLPTLGNFPVQMYVYKISLGNWPYRLSLSVNSPI
jgi:hypothetical protein